MCVRWRTWPRAAPHRCLSAPVLPGGRLDRFGYRPLGALRSSGLPVTRSSLDPTGHRDPARGLRCLGRGAHPRLGARLRLSPDLGIIWATRRAYTRKVTAGGTLGVGAP